MSSESDSENSPKITSLDVKEVESRTIFIIVKMIVIMFLMMVKKI